MVALSLAKMSRPSRGVGYEGIIRKECVNRSDQADRAVAQSARVVKMCHLYPPLRPGKDAECPRRREELST